MNQSISGKDTVTNPLPGMHGAHANGPFRRCLAQKEISLCVILGAIQIYRQKLQWSRHRILSLPGGMAQGHSTWIWLCIDSQKIAHNQQNTIMQNNSCFSSAEVWLRPQFCVVKSSSCKKRNVLHRIMPTTAPCCSGILVFLISTTFLRCTGEAVSMAACSSVL